MIGLHTLKLALLTLSKKATPALPTAVPYVVEVCVHVRVARRSCFDPISTRSIGIQVITALSQQQPFIRVPPLPFKAAVVVGGRTKLMLLPACCLNKGPLDSFFTSGPR